MIIEPVTRASLLLRLRNAGDSDAWSEFLEVYGPLVHRYGIRRGLQDADATDLVQEVMRQVSGAIGGFDYDPVLGTFRGWLLTITRRTLSRMVRQRVRQTAGTGDSNVHAVLRDVPAAEESAFWEDAYRRQVFQWASERVRVNVSESTWLAFWRTAVEGQRPKEVATSLGMKVGAVYVAKTRVLQKLKQQVREIDETECT